MYPHPMHYHPPPHPHPNTPTHMQITHLSALGIGANKSSSSSLSSKRLLLALGAADNVLADVAGLGAGVMELLDLMLPLRDVFSSSS